MLSEKYKLETVVKEPSVIYMERPLKAASHTIHIEVPPNPFWASIGLSVTPLPLGSGVQYESRVSLGYLNQSFQNAVRDGIRYGLEQGLFGWNVTDCKICFEYGLYYSPVSTPADFRSLAPIVLEQALKESGTQLLEPYLSFTLYAPREYLSRAYHDAPKYCATIETAQVKKDEVVFTGEIPARCIQAYRTDLAFYTNGQSVCLTPYVSEGNVKIHNRQDGNNQKLWRVTMEYSKEDLMEAKKQIWGVGENMGTEESKKIWEENAQFWDNAMGDEFLKSERAGQRRGGGLCKAAVN